MTSCNGPGGGSGHRPSSDWWMTRQCRAADADPYKEIQRPLGTARRGWSGSRRYRHASPSLFLSLTRLVNGSRVSSTWVSALSPVFHSPVRMGKRGTAGRVRWAPEPVRNAARPAPFASLGPEMSSAWARLLKGPRGRPCAAPRGLAAAYRSYALLSFKLCLCNIFY